MKNDYINNNNNNNVNEETEERKVGTGTMIVCGAVVLVAGTVAAGPMLVYKCYDMARNKLNERKVKCAEKKKSNEYKSADIENKKQELEEKYKLIKDLLDSDRDILTKAEIRQYEYMLKNMAIELNKYNNIKY